VRCQTHSDYIVFFRIVSPFFPSRSLAVAPAAVAAAAAAAGRSFSLTVSCHLSATRRCPLIVVSPPLFNASMLCWPFIVNAYIHHGRITVKQKETVRVRQFYVPIFHPTIVYSSFAWFNAKYFAKRTIYRIVKWPGLWLIERAGFYRP